MKKNAILGTTFILLCCLMTPIITSASTTKQKAHRKAVIACEGKKTGDSVEFINKWNKRIKGICQEEKGELVATPLKKENK
jgi:hypothetical protein